MVLVLLLWEKRVFYATWSPFTWLVGYVDPRRVGEGDALYGEDESFVLFILIEGVM